MTVGEAVKLLEENGFIFKNQVGSHMKYSRGTERITLVKHRSNKERLHPRAIKQVKTLIDGKS